MTTTGTDEPLAARPSDLPLRRRVRQPGAATTSAHAPGAIDRSSGRTIPGSGTTSPAGPTSRRGPRTRPRQSGEGRHLELPAPVPPSGSGSALCDSGVRAPRQCCEPARPIPTRATSSAPTRPPPETTSASTPSTRVHGASPVLPGPDTCPSSRGLQAARRTSTAAATTIDGFSQDQNAGIFQHRRVRQLHPGWGVGPARLGGLRTPRAAMSQAPSEPRSSPRTFSAPNLSAVAGPHQRTCFFT